MMALLRIRIGFNADFYLNAAKPVQIHGDPDPVRTLPSQKVDFCREKYTILYEGNSRVCHKTWVPTYRYLLGTVQKPS
jgi:hypothetical protein